MLFADLVGFTTLAEAGGLPAAGAGLYGDPLLLARASTLPSTLWTSKLGGDPVSARPSPGRVTW